MPKCMICGGDVDITRKVYKYKSVAFKEAFPTVNICVCKKCRLYQADIENCADNNDRLFKYYENDYRSDTSRRIRLDSKNNNLYVRAKAMTQMFARIFPKDAEIKVFEKGCGIGFNLQHIKEYFMRASLYSDEMDEYSEESRKKIGVESVAIDGDNNNYDVIIISHVLEHLLNPIETIKSADEHLVSGGYLYIEVPNNLRFEEPHVSFWSEESLKLLFDNFFNKNFKVCRVWTTGLPEIFNGNMIEQQLQKVIVKVISRIFGAYRFLNIKNRNGSQLKLLAQKI